MMTFLRAGMCLGLCVLVACQAPGPKDVLLSPKGAVEMRAMQSRVFETNDRSKTIRTVIATLQDLGYSIEKVEASAGTVTARKLHALMVTVSVFPRGKRQTVVRANAVVVLETGSSQVDAPQFYQQRVFEPLAKAMFLDANADNSVADADEKAAAPNSKQTDDGAAAPKKSN